MLSSLARATWSSLASLKQFSRVSSSIKPFCAINVSAMNRYMATDKKTVQINFIDRDGDKITVNAKLGVNLLDVAIDNNIDIEGACEGTLSCSTCHVILSKENYVKLKEPSDEENDMLDLAYGLTDTSRLGCQIIVNEDMNGWTFVLPKEKKGTIFY